MDFVIQPQPLTQVGCGKNGPAQVEQSYNIEFFTTPRNSTEQVVQSRSGNPGYITGLPLLIGQPDPANEGAKLVYQNGFQVSGVDSLGRCIMAPKPKGTLNADIGDPVVNF